MGNTDTAMLFTIIIIFIALGFVMPFINSAFSQTAINNNAQGLSDDIGQNLEANEVSILEVFVSIITMFFWTFGNIPLVLDILIMLPMRMLMGVLIYRNIRGN